MLIKNYFNQKSIFSVVDEDLDLGLSNGYIFLSVKNDKSVMLFWRKTIYANFPFPVYSENAPARPPAHPPACPIWEVSLLYLSQVYKSQCAIGRTDGYPDSRSFL